MKKKSTNTICQRVGVYPLPPDSTSIVGLAIETLGESVIHALRHPPELNSNGWYIWSGEFSDRPDFFKPICVDHLSKYLKVDLAEYLDLPPGFRFLIDGNNYEDVWFDENLLK